MIILLEKTTLIKSKKEEEEVIPILSHTSRKHYLVNFRRQVWNGTLQNFLVDKHGTPIKWYGPSTQPLRITKDIEKLLLQDM